ncbi:MAG: tripartite tricarboxylate transporter substrate binding protein [Sheuella sp.]|nr:tripartite tricarboxylate transporter substrate binding protein [Sheuella sp.]
MKSILKTFFVVLLATLLSPATAQEQYPNKPIKFIVPYPAGGVSDNSSRAIADRLGRELGQTMIIENKAGAASTLSSNYVARSAPDGYTLYAAPVSIVINPVLQAKVEYDAQRDFAPISMMITSAFVLQANLDLKVKDLKELLALIRANPDKFAIGTSGMGSINHLAAEYFIKNFGLKMAVIHYKGGAPAATDLIGGRIHMMFSATNEALPLVSSGRTQGIAVSTAKRISSLPDLPTIDEASGTKGFDAVFWLALLAPAKTPAPVLKRLEAAMQVVGADQTLRDDLAKKGVDLYVSTPAEVQSFMQRDGSKWGEIIRQLGIKE